MSSLKPIKLFSHAGGPNPWKVAITLEELGIPYETEFPDPSTVHTPSYEKYNPNGRLPAIIDPNNNDFVLWESGAIVEYLVEKYDKEHKLSFTDDAERYKAKQYLHFQMSGQGPYFGQAIWFGVFHSEKLPSAVERYHKEIVRYTKVLDSILAGQEWLVGGKFSYADIVFIPWYWVVESYPNTAELWKEVSESCPNFKAWHDRLNARPIVKKLKEEREEKRKA